MSATQRRPTPKAVYLGRITLDRQPGIAFVGRRQGRTTTGIQVKMAFSEAQSAAGSTRRPAATRRPASSVTLATSVPLDKST